jgi:signal transduction histidine kinase
VVGEGLTGGVEAVAGPVFEARDGAVWLGVAQGAVRFRDGRFRFLSAADGLPLGAVTAFAEDAAGGVWTGSDTGLARWRPDAPPVTAQGLPAGTVHALLVTPDDTVWVAAGENGFGRLLDGVFHPVPVPEHEGGLAVSALTHDDLGRLWVLTDRGLFHAQWTPLATAAAHPGLWRLAVRADEISAPVLGRVRSPAVARSADGRLWFPTLRGLVAVDPALDLTNPLPPPVRIEGALVDARPAVVPATGELVVPPGRRQVELRYAGLSFHGPVRYQRRLEPLDPDWRDAGRERSAVFNGLAPGRYRFRVRAANSDGVWNDTGASLDLWVRPAWWETAAFRAAAGLLLAGLAAAVVWWASTRNLRRALARLEQQQALERERARLARDLHDDVGASLTVLAVQTEIARRELGPDSAAAERFDRIAAAARDTVQRLDEVVWTVNPGNDALDRFADYLCHQVEQTAAAAGLRLRWEAPSPVPPRPLPAETRHALLLIVKEALQNVVKHAAAAEVRVALGLAGPRLTLQVEDDGRGFDPACPPRSAGDGLGNLRRRAAALRAELAVESRPGHGTRVTVGLNLPG